MGASRVMGTASKVLRLVLWGVFGSTIGCNLLLNIGDYRKQDAGGADAGVDAPEFDAALDTGTTDAGADVLQPPEGARADRWARWIMPNYVDASISPARYVQSPTETLDDVTKVTWLRATQGTAPTFAAAQDACKAKGNYRLPSRIELVSILDLSHASDGTIKANLDALGITGMLKVEYWTLSYVSPAGPQGFSFWMVDFNSGKTNRVFPDGKTAYGVLCVKDS